MKFQYRAYAADDPKRTIEEVLEADSREEAASTLRRQGFLPIDIKPISEKKFDPNNIQIGRKKVKLRELAIFTRQFATMIKAGMNPTASLEVVSRPMKNAWFKDSLKDVQDAINSGSDLSSAFARHPKIFKPLYISLVRAGESGGILPEALERLAEQMERDAALQSEIKGALVYPIVVITFAILIIVAMLLFVIPVFATIFEETGGKLPAPTQLLVSTSDLVKKFWFLLPLVPPAIFYAIKWILSTEKGRWTWDSAKMKFPMKIGPLYIKVVTARFTRTLSTLLAAGVPILEALQITAPTANNVVINQKIESAMEQIRSGQNISIALKGMEIFPEMATAMIQAGEEAGALVPMLGKVADTYEEEVAIAIKGLKSIMEPILMIGIGTIVGFVVIALYMPIFKVYDQIK